MQEQKTLRTVWVGTVDWQSKIGNSIVRTYSCQISSKVTENGEPEFKAEKWPKRLPMYVIPKKIMSAQIIGHLKTACRVNCHFKAHPDVLKALSSVMRMGYVGCIPVQNIPACDSRVMIVIYVLGSFFGFVPNDLGLMNHLLNVVTLRKKEVAKQNQTTLPTDNTDRRSGQHQVTQPSGGPVINQLQQPQVGRPHGLNGVGTGVTEPDMARGVRAATALERRAWGLIQTQQLKMRVEVAKQIATEKQNGGPSTSTAGNGALVNDGAPTYKRKCEENSGSSVPKTPKTPKHTTRVIDDTFSCIVCQRPMQHPVFTNCCKSLVACKKCSADWAAKSNTCLKCQSVNPVYTELKGMHDAISALTEGSFFN